MSNIILVVQKYVLDHYPDLITPSTPIYNERMKMWEARLHSTYPRIIKDERTGEVIVRFLNLRDLGVIRINDKLEIIDATSEEKSEHQLISRIDSWRIQSEQIVVKASSDAFAKIAEGEHVLNPLILIFERLAELQDNFTISEAEIDDQQRSPKIREYLQLLEELEIVKKVDNAYTYGSAYVGILEQTTAKGLELQTALISHVIKRKYSALRQVFGIGQLEPYVHLANSFYWPSLDAEQLVHTTRKILMERYREFYGRVFTWGFNSKLSQLIRQGAIVEENGFLTGDKSRFESMLEMKRSGRQLNP